MAAYLVCTIVIDDPDAYKAYIAVTPTIIAAHGGRFIVRGGEKETLEGPELTERLTVIEFESMEAARGFYYSAEYQEAIEKRRPCSTARFVLADGLA
jgi:uncharacterized protein (DUF1330 family)